MRTSIIAIVLSAALAAAALAKSVRSACWWRDEICPGIRLAGEVLAIGADPDVLLGQRASELSSRPLEVTVEGVPEARRTFTMGELGVVLDVARTASLVRAVGHQGGRAARFAESQRAARGEVDVPIMVEVNRRIAETALMPIKDDADQLPVPARLDIAGGGIVPQVPGYFVDLEGATEQIRTAALSGATAIELGRASFEPRVSTELLQGIDVHQLLARFRTSFSRHGEQELRALNIETVAARLDGVVLLPGDLFSFNARVGPRTVENGFSKGWEIYKGEMVEGIGGGSCQAASTLHAAAFLSGLDVIERLPHSRPSAYITMGLDATVVYPVVDLKLRNPYDFPVVIHGYVEGDSVVFEILGRERPVRVTFGREILATRPYTRRIEEKPGLAADRIVRKQHGIVGYKIRRTRTIEYGTGAARRESNVDVYWPTVELYQVAPGTDAEGKLPPPGEGLDESGTAGWSILETDSPPAPSQSASALELAASSPSPSSLGSVDAVEGRPKIVEAPGVHAPRAEQLRAPVKIIIGSAPVGR